MLGRIVGRIWVVLGCVCMYTMDRGTADNMMFSHRTAAFF